MLFYFTKVRTTTEKIAWVIILTNLINRGEDMQVMYKKLQDRNKGRSRTHDMSQYINIGSHLPADSIIIFILHCKCTTLLNTKQEKSIGFRLKQHNKGRIGEVNHYYSLKYNEKGF